VRALVRDSFTTLLERHNALAQSCTSVAKSPPALLISISLVSLGSLFSFLKSHYILQRIETAPYMTDPKFKPIDTGSNPKKNTRDKVNQGTSCVEMTETCTDTHRSRQGPIHQV
jgi:hypothetical protein